MKAIKITDANLQKIDAAISLVEGKATARTASSADVLHCVKLAEARLATVLPKTRWTGAKATFNGDVVPNSYGARADGTFVSIERKGTSWYFVGAHRRPVRKARHGQASDRGALRLTIPVVSGEAGSFWDSTLSHIGDHVGIDFVLLGSVVMERPSGSECEK